MTSRKKVYIAGPMAGIDDFNYPAFFAMEKHLHDLGLDAINPARLDHHDEIEELEGLVVDPLQRASFLKRDFFYLSQANGIVMLDGWQESTGANCELWVARMMGLVVFTGGEEDGEIVVRPAPRLMPLYGPMALHARDVMMQQAIL